MISSINKKGITEYRLNSFFGTEVNFENFSNMKGFPVQSKVKDENRKWLEDGKTQHTEVMRKYWEPQKKMDKK